MSDARSWALRAAKIGGGLGAAWAAWAWLVPVLFAALGRVVMAAGARVWEGSSVAQAGPLRDLLVDGQFLLREELLLPFLFAATLVVPIGALARTVARARVRAGFADPVDRARFRLTAHPRLARAMLATPAALWLAALALAAVPYAWSWGGPAMYGDLAGSPPVQHLHSIYATGMALFACLVATGALGVHAATRAGARALLAPTLDAEETTHEMARERGEGITFDAVAVTPETLGAVSVMALLPVMTVLGVSAARLGDVATQIALATYVAAAAGGAMLFRRASKVAVGIDGVLVKGSSRTRFFAYRDVDEARAEGSSVVLSRRGKVVVRLQLHGEDARRRDAILATMQAAVARAREAGKAPAARAVESRSAEELARLAQGGGDYRAAAVTREELWALVEGPSEDARTRAVVAGALAATGDEGERVRMRVAAVRCAEPPARLALEEMAEEAERGEAKARRRA